MKGYLKAVVFATAIGPISQSVAAERVLRLTIQLPLTNVLGQNVVAFKQIVERESRGEVIIEIYASPELYVDKEVPKAVSSGAIEMGEAPVTRFASLKPTVGLVSLPFMFANSEHVAAAVAPGHGVREVLD